MLWNGVKIDKYDGRALIENLPNWNSMKRTQTDEGNFLDRKTSELG